MNVPAFPAEFDAPPCQVERLSRIMAKWRRRQEANDEGTWLALYRACEACPGLSRDAVRGLLIKGIARGTIEAGDFSDGVGYRATL